ncbi:MAG: hypothetical protein E7616_08195 [Ruminococcaceae bacterium]|nr:hypothetical protein [Oscillospiraceae bacterium]
MKKVWIFCVLLLFLLVSCGKESPSTLSLVTDILEAHPSLPAGDVIYHSGALPGQKAYMTPRLQSLLYDDGRDREMPEFSAVLDYAVNLSDGQYGMEIHAFHMASEADARSMEKLLTRRIRLLKRRRLYLYAPDAYEDYLVSAVVVIEKEYVFLLATGRNEQILKQLRDRL